MKTINTHCIKNPNSKDIRFIRALAKLKYLKSYDKHWRQYKLIKSKPTTNFKTDTFMIINGYFLRYKFIRVKTDVNNIWFMLIKFNNKVDLFYITNTDEVFYQVKNKVLDYVLQEFSAYAVVRNNSKISDVITFENTIINLSLGELTSFLESNHDNIISSFAYFSKFRVKNLSENELVTIFITKEYRYLFNFEIDKLEKILRVRFCREAKDDNEYYTSSITIKTWKKEFEDFEKYIENFKPSKDYNLKISSNNFEYSKEVANYYFGLINE